MLKLVKESEKELLNYAQKGMGYRAKRTVKMLLGKRVTPMDKINWPTGLLAKGLADYYNTHNYSEEAENILNALKNYYNIWISDNHKIYYLDDTLSGMALIDLHQITGEEKYKQAADIMAQYLLRHKTDKVGNLPYRPGQENNYVFVDGIGMICPFLCKYGYTYGDRNVIDLALTQIQNYFAYGMDENTGLPYHGYHYESRTKYGIIGWGRAVGWLMVGIAESLYYLDKLKVDCEPIWQDYNQLLSRVVKYQLKDGLFCWQLEALDGPQDTSATSMILYAIAKTSYEEYEELIIKGCKALMNSTKEGKVYDCLAECQGFSMYPQAYGAYPWSLGPTLSLFTLVEEKGV